MPYGLLADFVVLLHLFFVLFVMLGGLVVVKWPRLAWLHLPAVAWGAWVELSGWICPLTPLENWLRAQGGEASYPGDFIAQYLSAVLYPDSLTREMQIVLGLLVITVNLGIYGRLWLDNRL